MSPDPENAHALLRNALKDLARTIRTLPEDQQLDAFLASCASLLNTLSQPMIEQALEDLRVRFPDHDNEILTLIEGHLAMRELQSRK